MIQFVFLESDLEFNLDGSAVSILNDDLSKLISDEANPLLINLKNTGPSMISPPT